jgi:tetratricopeptide (TPR) repeat protein
MPDRPAARSPGAGASKRPGRATTPTRRHYPLRWKLAASLGALVVFLAMLELLLQLAALLARPGRAGLPGSRGGAIVCVGDSFTYGIGAEPGRSYPAQLQERLSSRYPDLDIEVVNAGVPGANTGEVLARLREELALRRPLAVVMLAGINNRWSRRPARDVDGLVDGSGGGLPGRLRIYRLWRLLWFRLERLLTDRDKGPRFDRQRAHEPCEPKGPSLGSGGAELPSLLGPPGSEGERRGELLSWLRRHPPSTLLDPGLLAELARSALDMGMLDQAGELAERCLDLDRGRTACLDVLAWSEVGRGRVDSGLEALEQAIRLDPCSVELWASRARLLLRLGHPGLAVPALERLAARQPDSRELSQLLSAARAFIGQAPGLASTRVAEGDPLLEEIQAEQELIRCEILGLLERDRPDVAARVVAEAFRAAGREADGVLGALLLVAKAPPDPSALTPLLAVVKVNPHSVYAHAAIEMLRAMLHALAEHSFAPSAFDACTCMAEGEPREENSLLLAMSLVQAAAERDSEGVSRLRAVWMDKAKTAPLAFILALSECLERFDYLEEALAVVNAAMYRLPDSRELTYRVYELEDAMLREEEAYESSKRLVPYEGWRPEFWFERSRRLRDEPRFLAPRSCDLERCIELQPECGECLGRLALLMSGLGRKDRALELSRRALVAEFSPSGETLLRLLDDYLQGDREDAAIEREFRALGLSPDRGGESGQVVRRQRGVVQDIERALQLLEPLEIPLVLLDYPNDNVDLEPLFDSFQERRGVIRVHVFQHFSGLLERAPRERYFVADGHCTGRGYGVMANLVFEALRPLLDRMRRDQTGTDREAG